MISLFFLNKATEIVIGPSLPIIIIIDIIIFPMKDKFVVTFKIP